MHRLAYVLITASRPKLVSEFLNTVSASSHKKEIAVYIQDGSEDDETQKVIESCAFDNIYYSHDRLKSFAERTVQGAYEANADYICITGDSQLPICANHDYLFGLFDRAYDLITLSYRDKKHIGLRVYDDILYYFKENGWDTTLFGTVFFRKASYAVLNVKEFMERYGENPFPQVVIYFNYFANNQFNGYYEGNPIIEISKNKKESSWKDIFLVYGKQWCECIEYLDAQYNRYKKDVILDHGKYSSLDLANIDGFRLLKLNGQFSEDILCKYSDIIDRMTSIDTAALQRICREPRIVSEVLYLIYRIRNKALRIIAKGEKK